ncbi:Trigger factor [Frankliniella fusca]|uniref:Trigger factor n=1 Tax=Frankliniella fusca TaxID=407009 RepID=A0AAE1H0I8_9NEOP|nr:Trigger factor [Frankliniella fusca]
MKSLGSQDNACCDPYRRHKRPIRKTLRKITESDLKVNPQLQLGLFWCDNCRKSNGNRSTEQVAGKVDGGDDQNAKNDCGNKSEAEILGTVCCDPHKRHKKPVLQNLRKISASDLTRNPQLTIDLWWCDSCRKRKVSEDVSASTAVGGASSSQNDKQSQENTENLKLLQGLDFSSIEVPSKRKVKPLTSPSALDSEELKDVCCNPYKIHSKPVFKNLRVIRERDLTKVSVLTIGEFWCDFCRKADPDDYLKPQDSETTDDAGLAALFSEIAEELAGTHSEPSSQDVVNQAASQGSGTTDSPSLSPAIQKESAHRSLATIGLSPLVVHNLRTQGSKIRTAKRKADEAASIVRKKVCRALGISENDLISNEAQRARDHDLLMNEIKQKLPIASKAQKYQLLSLVPLSMSLNEAAEYFEVSRTLLRRARQIKVEQGILPTLHFTRTSTVLESTKLLIKEYYSREDNCKILPGTRDCVSIRKGVYEQKRLLLSNLPELYQQFKSEYEDLKVGLTTFSSLKPKWCVFAGGAGTHEQCICQTHQNIKLLMYALNVKTHYRDLIKLCVCNIEDRSCMLKVCENCPNLDAVIEILKKQIVLPEFEESEDDSDNELYDYFEESIKFRQWKSVGDRTEMVVQICSRSELLEIGSKQMMDLITHDFIACSQRDYLKKLKEDLPQNKVVIAMDFSMNYNCLVQGAVQSYHWSPKQATVHPTIIYIKNENGDLDRRSLIFISDDLEHDVPLVRKIQERTVAFLKEHFPHITDVEWATDGCASQYKSKGYFLNLCSQEEEFGLKASHSYFATSHGKSQCDADGGSVKRKARKASLQRPLDKQIISAQDLFQFCEENMQEKFIFKFINKSDVQPERELYHQRVAELQTVPGTRSFHYLKPQPGNMLACWRISFDQNKAPALVHSMYRQPSQTTPVSVANGMNVVARLGKNRYVALVTDVNLQEEEADLLMLMPKLPAKEFRWPKEIKTAVVPLPHILCEVTLSETQGLFRFTENDVLKLYSHKILRKPKVN